MPKAKKKKPGKKKPAKKPARKSPGKNFLKIGSKLLGPDIKQQLSEMAQTYYEREMLLDEVETFLGELCTKNKKQAKLLAETTPVYDWFRIMEIGIEYFAKKGK